MRRRDKRPRCSFQARLSRKSATASGESRCLQAGRAKSNHVQMLHARDPLGYSFQKHRLAQGWSYPLKRSLLDQALVKAGALNVASVSYCLVMSALDERRTGTLIAQYRGAAMPGPGPGEVSIYVLSVPSIQRADVALGLANALAGVARWIYATEHREPTWRTESHGLHVTVVDGETTLREDPSR